MSKGGTKTRLPAGLDALSLIQAQAAQKGAPGRGEMLKQVQEALATGGVGARIPIVQRAVEQQRMAGAEALKGAEEQLAARGITGSFVGKTLAGLRQQTAQAEAKVPTDMTTRFLNEFGKQSLYGIPGGSLASGQASETTPDTMTPAIGAGAAVVGAVIVAI